MSLPAGLTFDVVYGEAMRATEFPWKRGLRTRVLGALSRISQSDFAWDLFDEAKFLSFKNAGEGTLRELLRFLESVYANQPECPASEPCALDDPVVANLRATAEIQGRPPTWGEIRYLLAHIDGMRGYAETGKDVEGVLIQANLDDFEQTPGETVLWLIDRICSAETALFLGAHAEGMATSAVGECARAHFKKYPNGIHATNHATPPVSP